MNLSGALSNALSGLTVNARGTVVISSNIANAMNEAYSARTIQLTTDATQSSGGVKVAGVSRYDDPVAAFQNRAANAQQGQAMVLARAAQQIESLWGSVDTVGSVAEKLTRFETALLSAASDPSSDVRLRNVARAAEAFTAAIRDSSDGIQTMRSRADAAISDMVDRLNGGLERLESLNRKIVLGQHLGQDTLGLRDQRDAELDALSEFVPLHVVERDSGAVAVFSHQGKTLLDTQRSVFGFTPQPIVQAHMTQSNGLLSSLTVNGTDIDNDGSLAGGALAAQFEIRDRLATDTQARLDGIARDIIERFGPGGPDATVGPGDTGAFTDDGAPFVAVNEVGLASRLRLNDALASSAPDPWRWRDGIQALSSGDAGDSSTLRALNDVLTTPRVPGATALGSAPVSLVQHVQSLATRLSADRVISDDALAFADAQLSSIRESAGRNTVNTDQELQKLIELEKSYAANARVVQVVDDMLSELLRI